MFSKEITHNTFIVVVTYNGMPWIQRCLESCGNYPVIVVDNASTDGTLVYIKDKFPKVHLIVQHKNLGFGQANNKGISYALKYGAEDVFLLNQDAYLQEDSIEKLNVIKKDYPSYGILSPIHLDGKGERLDIHFANYVNYKNNKDFYSDFVLSKTVKPVYEVPMVNAAGWFLTSSILKKVGGFDTIFFHYGEDDNYCQRAKFHGFKIGVVTQTYLRHDKETREAVKVGWRTSEYYSRMERELKIKYADINKENVSELHNIRLKIRKKYIRSLYKLQFRKKQDYKKELMLLNRLIPEIEESRKRNKVQKSHYLDYS